MCNSKSYFSSYKPFYQPTIIQGIGKIFSVIRIGNVSLIVKYKSGKKSEVFLLRVIHISNLFTNFISGNKLLKKSYYFYSNNQIINLCNDNMKIAFCLI